MRTATLLLTALVIGLGPAAADEQDPKKPQPPLLDEQAADKVLAAVETTDDAALKTLAAQRWPDIWFVADVLCARGKREAALALARTASGKDVERLPAYVQAWRWKSTDPDARAVFVAQDAGNWNTVLQRSAVVVAERSPVAVVRVQHARGRALQAQRKLAGARASFHAAAKAAEAVGWLAGEAQGLFAEGNCAFDGGDYRGALTAWSRRLAVERKRGFADQTAHTLMTVANAHHYLRQFDQALAHHREALALIKAERPGRPLVSVLLNLGNLHYDMEAYESAREVQERALALAEQIGLAWERAQLLSNLGNTYQALGAGDRALAVLERALQAARQMGNHRLAARALHNIGYVCQEQGRYADALRAQEKALPLVERLGDPQALASLLGNLANTHELLGDLDRALELQRRALLISEETGDRLGIARAMLNLGNLHYARDEHEAALAIEARALVIVEALSHKGMQANLLGNMANSHHGLGQLDQALALQQRALALLRELKDEELIALSLANIGTYHRRAGRHEEALRHLREAIVVANRVGSPRHEVFARGEMVLALTGLGKTADAVREARVVAGMALRLFSGLADEQGAMAREKVWFIFEAGATAAGRTRDAEQLAYFLEAGRAGSLLEFLGRRDALHAASVPVELRRREKEARAAESRAVAAYGKAQQSGRLAKMRAAKAGMNKARKEMADVVARIQREVKRAAGVFYPQPVSLPRIRARLKPGDALVLYGFFEEAPLALVVTPTEARVVPLARGTTITAAIDAFDPARRESDPREAAAKVRTLLVKPLGLPKGTRRLLISPDGPLGYVPFALLAPDHEVVYVPSATTYDLLFEDHALRGEGVLALGDPAYAFAAADPAVERYRGGVRLMRLPATLLEAKAVGSTLLLGSDATEGGLREALAGKPRWRAVHFACHGLVDPENPGLSSLALVQQGEDDGFLTALDVFGMSIPADVAVLSACETGRGKIVRGEGIVGLTRAFMFAGTPRVLVSLWKVDDEATQALMIKFYELWNPKGGRTGLGAAAALKKAQEFIRGHDKWKHPYYWAAWVLWGLPD